jgi:PAS domain S-box-containing protein
MPGSDPVISNDRPAAPTAADHAASARLAAIVQSSDDAIVSKDVNGTIMSWNPAAERMFGYTAAEAVGKSIRIIIPEDRQTEEDDVLARIVRGQLVDHFETVRRRKDGTDIFVSVTVSPVFDQQGRIIGASKIARDITEQKRASERSAFLVDMAALLAGSLDYEVTLRSIARLSTTPFPGATYSFADYALIDILERDGTLRRIAAAHRDSRQEHLLEQARGYAPDREGSPLARPLRTGQPILVSNISENDMRSMSRGPDHLRIMRELGPKSLIGVPLTARGATFGIFTLLRTQVGQPYTNADLLFAVEIAQRAALFADNARLYAESQQAVRAREHVLAIVSHDFRNALGVIGTSAQLLSVSTTDEEQRKRRLQTLVRVSHRMTRLVQDLLDVSKLQAGHTLSVNATEHDVRPLVQEACDSYRGLMEEKFIALECVPPESLLTVLADRDRILQVLTNLVGNAVKFTPEGGTVGVSATAIDGEVEFCVSDTGPGIRTEEVEHIFDRFWQAAGTASLGTGLGLPIAKGIVEAHGGRIWVESRPGIGTTFYFTIPAAPAASTSAPGGVTRT